MNDSPGYFTALILIALLILSTGCIAANGTAKASPEFSPSSSQPHQVTGVDSRNETQIREFLVNFDTNAGNARNDWNVPGMAVAVVKDGKIIFAKGYGTKTAGSFDPVTADTVFQIGSTSKAFTAALAAMEVDSGRMDWNDPVILYVPDFQMKDPWVTKEFTITDSLAQRSGLPGYWGTSLEQLGYSRSDMIHALRYATPDSSFRSEYKYQNLPFLVTAAAIENTSRLSWEDNMQSRIFTPLNMTSASTNYSAFLAAPDHTSLHTIGVLPGNTTGPVVIAPDGEFNDFPYVMGPAGGVNANVQDIARWAIFQLGNGTVGGNQLISPKNMAYMHTPRTPLEDVMEDTKQYYCQAWIYEEKTGSPSVVWHNGETLGNHAMILLVPDENLGIVVLANEAASSLPEALAWSFYTQYFGTGNPDYSIEDLKAFRNETAELLAPPAVRPENATPPRTLSAYTGSYVNDIFGTATVTEKNGNLTITLGKKPATLLLSPWDGNTFTTVYTASGQDQAGNAVFSTGSDGVIRYLNISMFAEEPGKPETFVRV